MRQIRIFIVISAIISTSAFAANITDGKAKTASCVVCHGATGNSVVATFPKLAAQGEGYLLKQLQDFKNGDRKDVVMNAQVAHLNATDMANIAAFYAKQTISKGVKTTDKKAIHLGKKIYRSGKKEVHITACSACHGPQGKGIPSAKFPSLASQHPEYLIKQLSDFRQDSLNTQLDTHAANRINDHDSIMRNVTENLSNKEIRSLALYISGL